MTVRAQATCHAWLALLLQVFVVFEARADSRELYQLAVQDLADCGTSFDQQSVQLRNGDAIFMRGRCIHWWVAADGALLRVPGLPAETVQAALAQGPDGAIYLSGGRTYYGDARFTGVDARPKDAVYRWSPGSPAWSEAPRLNVARAKHASVGLSDGRIAVIGGEGTQVSGNPFPLLSSVEFLAPSEFGSASTPRNVFRASWRLGPSLQDARASAAVLVTQSGDILVIGGESRQAGLASVEMLPSGGQSWQRLAPMREGRYGHTATLLRDGRILVTGGMSARGRALDAAEIWSPAPAPLGSWRSAGTMPGGPRAHHTATLLEDGRVLVIGGVVADGQPGTRTTAVWSPRDGSWQSDAELPEPPFHQGAFLQKDHSVLVISSAPFQKIYNTDSTLAYRFRLQQDLTAVDVLTERAINKGSGFLASGEKDSIASQVRDDVVSRLLSYTESSNNATCDAAWGALAAIGGSAYPHVIARAAAVLNSAPCRSYPPDKVLAILESATEPLSPSVTDQVAYYFEARGDLIALRDLARKHTFSHAAIARWLTPQHPRLPLAFEGLIAKDTLRFDDRLADLAKLVGAEEERLRREDPPRYAALQSLLKRIAAEASALPMRELSAGDGLPRDVEIRRAALDVLALGLMADAYPADALPATEQPLIDKLAEFIKRDRTYLSDPVDVGRLKPGVGAPVFTIFGLGGIPRANSYLALRIVRPAITVASETQAALAWDVVDEETLDPDDIKTVDDPESGNKNVTVRTTTPNCAEGRTTLRYDPARKDFARPLFRCLRASK